MKRGVVFALAATVVGHLVAVGQAAAQTNEDAQITLAAERLMAAYNQRDLNTLTRLFAEDAVLVADGKRAVGRAEVIAQYEAEFAQPATGILVLKGTRTDVWGDAAAQAGTSTVAVPDGRRMLRGESTWQATAPGHYLVVVERQQGEWRIAYLATQRQPAAK